MTADSLQAIDPPSSTAPSDLQAMLRAVVGELFRFVRFSYPNQLTIHLGDLEMRRVGRFGDKPFGTYFLGVLASAWVLKSGREPRTISNPAADPFAMSGPDGLPIDKAAVVADPLITPGARVVSAEAFLTTFHCGGYGLRIRFSDDAALVVLPSSEERDERGTPIPVADWVVISPLGALDAGPGAAWKFFPRSEWPDRSRRGGANSENPGPSTAALIESQS